MGIVIKQSFWNSIWAYVGVGIGFINTLVLRPAFFTDSQIGIVTTITGNALMLAPFVALGMPSTYIRYFAELKDNPALKTKVLSLQFSLIFTANILICLIAFFGFEWIKEIYIDKSPEYVKYIYASVLIMVLFSLFMQMHSFSRSMFNSVFPGFLKETFLRIGNLVLILLFSWNILSFDELVNGLICSYLISSISLGVYILFVQKIRLSIDIFSVPSTWLQKIYKIGSFNFLMAGCNSIYNNVSIAMIPAILGSSATGVYGICLYIGIIIELPKRSMLQIITPILAQEFKKNNFKEIEILYQKSSINLGVIGLLFLIGVITNLNDLFLLIPNGEIYSAGFYVVVGIAVAKIIGMIFSFNSELLYYTKYYKYNIYLFIIISFLIVGLNYILLPRIGINGAAVAFIISTVLFSLTKFIFIKVKFNMTPFTPKHVPLLVYSGITFVIFWFLPINTSPLFNIIVRSIGISVVFITVVYISKISADINGLIKVNFKKYLKINLP
ncbi:MAG: polysaccharide biosynthesis C-terminal domain-containing protein [Cyclobacteriaceae bacterium]